MELAREAATTTTTTTTASTTKTPSAPTMPITRRRPNCSDSTHWSITTCLVIVTSFSDINIVEFTI